MKKHSLIFIIFLLSLQFFYSQEKTVSFTTLEWPPFTGNTLTGKGLLSYIVQKAFEEEGYKLEIAFYPWPRTIDMAIKTDSIMGYFPEYYSKDIEKTFYFSDPIGESILGFAESKYKPIEWNTLEDLKKYKIGTVIGYVNSFEFDKLVSNNELQIESVTNDLLNIKKVGAQRISLAVIDKYVLEYYLRNDMSLSSLKNNIQFNSKALETKKLYICFKKNEMGKKYLEIFNKGLKKLDIKKIENEYINKFLLQ